MLQKLKAIRFSEQSIQWFRSHLCDRIFLVETENKLSDFEKISCGVPQGSILGPLLFLIYVNDISKAVKPYLLLYADDSCLMYQHKGIAIIEKILNEDFENICDSFIKLYFVMLELYRKRTNKTQYVKMSEAFFKIHLHHQTLYKINIKSLMM